MNRVSAGDFGGSFDGVSCACLSRSTTSPQTIFFDRHSSSLAEVGPQAFAGAAIPAADRSFSAAEVTCDLDQAESIPMQKPDDLRIQRSEMREGLVQFVVTRWLKLLLRKRLVAETISERLASNPAAVTSGEYTASDAE